MKGRTRWRGQRLALSLLLSVTMALSGVPTTALSEALGEVYEPTEQDAGSGDASTNQMPEVGPEPTARQESNPVPESQTEEKAATETKPASTREGEAAQESEAARGDQDARGNLQVSLTLNNAPGGSEVLPYIVTIQNADGTFVGADGSTLDGANETDNRARMQVSQATPLELSGLPAGAYKVNVVDAPAIEGYALNEGESTIQLETSVEEEGTAGATLIMSYDQVAKEPEPQPEPQPEPTEDAKPTEDAEPTEDAKPEEQKAGDAAETSAPEPEAEKDATEADHKEPEANTQKTFVHEDDALKVTAELADPSVLPAGVRFVVTPVTSEVKAYNYDAYMEALNNVTNEQDKYTDKNTLLYDVAFLTTGEDGKDVEVQPDEGSVKVSFEFKKDQLAKKLDAPQAADVTVTHLPLADGVAASEVASDDIKAEPIADAKVIGEGTDTLTFEADSFSVYAFSYTVDFHYEGVDHSIPGESQILLSDLIEELQIKNGDELLKVADVERVQFTDEHLVEVAEVSGVITIMSRSSEKADVDAGDKNFLLSSKEPFTSDETLTITLANGKIIEVGVTDDQEITIGDLKYKLDDYALEATVVGVADSFNGSDITVPATVQPLDDDTTLYNVIKIDEYAFEGSVVKNVVVKGSITLDSYYGAFEKSSVETVRFEGDTTNIGSYQFWEVSSLKSVWAAAENSTLTLGNMAFQSCSNLTSLTAWSEATTTIEDGAFADAGMTAEQITYAYTPETTAYEDDVYTYALDKTENTATITGLSESYSGDYNLSIPNDVAADGTTYTINSIGKSAFSNNEKVQSVSLDSSTGIAIGESAFGGCSNMTGTLDGVTSIGNYAFRDTKISSVTMLGVRNIGTQALDATQSPIDFTIKGGDLHITHGIVSQSKNFKSITIDASGDLSFDDWSVQGDYWGGSKVETITVNCPNDINLPFQVFGDNYNDEFKSITINAHVTNVGGSAFKRLGSSSQPVTVNFTKGVDKISENAFGDDGSSEDAFHAASGSRIIINNNEEDTEYIDSSFPASNVTIIFNDKTINREPPHDDALTYRLRGDGKLAVTGLYEDEDGHTQSTFTVPSKLEWEGASYDVVAIEEGAFKGLSNLNVTVQGDIEVRGTYVNDQSGSTGGFAYVTDSTVTFQGKADLKASAFQGAQNLTVNANGSSIDLGQKAFAFVTGLNLATSASTKVTGGAYNVFQNAQGALDFEGGVDSIGGYSFLNCDDLDITTTTADTYGWGDYGLNQSSTSVNVTIEAEANASEIKWDAWGGVKSFTVNFADKLDWVWPDCYDLGNNGAVPVTINFNGGVGNIINGAFSGLKGAEGTVINIKGDSATVYEGSFPDDENLTVNFDMYYEDVTGAQYNDTLTKTTVTYKARDYREEGKEQKLLSDLIADMGLTMADGSSIDLSEVASVQFQKHDVTSTSVAGNILYNVAGDTPVNVGPADYLLTSGTAFTNEEAVCITLNDGTKIKSNWTDQADRYNIDGRDSIQLTDILRATGDSNVFNALGYSPQYAQYGDYFYFYWRVDDKDGNKLQDGFDLLADGYDFCKVTGVDNIEYPGYGKLYIYQYGAESNGWLTFSSGASYIFLIQNKKPVVPESDGVFIYKVEDSQAVITGVDPNYEGDGVVTVPATVELEDYDSEEVGVKKSYPVTTIKGLALMQDEKLKEITLADSNTPLLIEDAAIFQSKNLESVSGNRPVKFQSGGTGAAISENAALTSLTLRIDDTRVAIGQNDALKDVDLTIDTLSIDMSTLKGMDSVENLSITGNSITVGSNAFNYNDALKTLVVSSENPMAIGAFALKDKAELNSVTFVGKVTSIGNSAFAGDSALTTVTLGNAAGDTLTIEKEAFAGCTALKANNVVCKQIVKSEAGTVTIPSVGTGVPLGAYLVKTDIDEVEAIMTFADSWYKQNGNYCPIKDIVYVDFSLVRPNGKNVTGVAVDVLASNASDNRISIGKDATLYDKQTFEVFHLKDAAAGTVEHVSSQNDGFDGTKILNLSFHVDGLSPFALTVLSNKYHDDQFWYELNTDDPKNITATITGIYDGDSQDNPVTRLDFTGVTHDANAFKVVGFSDSALDTESNSSAIPGNKSVTSVLFTADGIMNTIPKSSTNYQYVVPEGLFAGCTNLENVQFGEQENTSLSRQLSLGKNVFKDCANMKTFVSHIARTFVNASAFEGCTGLETVVFTGMSNSSGHSSISEGAFAAATGLKYLRLDDAYAVNDRAFNATAGTAFVTKGATINYMADRIGKFNSYIYMGNNTESISSRSMVRNAPAVAYIAYPVADQYSNYVELIEHSHSNLKDLYFDCERSLFGEHAAALDDAAATKGITLHYNSNVFERALHLDGVKGNDSSATGSYEKPFKTYAALKEAWLVAGSPDSAVEETDEVIAPIVNPALEAVGINEKCGKFEDTYHTVQKAYITNAVTISSPETWDGGIALYRFPGDNKHDSFTGTMVENNSTLTLRDVVLDGSGEPAAGYSEGVDESPNASLNSASYVSATGPIVYSQGTLNIEQGAVVRNNKRTSAVYPNGAGGIYAGGTVNMTGGEIAGNTGLYGGGIEVLGSNARFTMSGGVIKNNVANGKSEGFGGGVLVASGATMDLSGGTISGNRVINPQSGSLGSGGGGIAVGGGVSGMCQGAMLNMTGGTVANNFAQNNGGGISIQDNCTANISGGSITGNHAQSGMFGGGGIYVNGNRAETDGELNLTNVLITQNTSEQEGGGLAGCATSDTSVYAIDGGAIYNNTSEDNSDVYISLALTAPSYVDTMKGHVTPYMFNGAACNWTDVYNNHKPVTLAQLANIRTLSHDSEIGLKANPTGDQPATAAVTITNNTSGTKGGGIGSNGTVNIGHIPDDKELSWTPEVNKVLYSRDMKEDETFTFKVYEEKVGQGFNFWWTKYEDVPVGIGSVTGIVDSVSKKIGFDSINLGTISGSAVGSTRTFLFVEDKPAADSDLMVPNKYLAITVIIATKWDEAAKEEVLTAEVSKIEEGKILANGDFEFDDGTDLFGHSVEGVTNKDNFGRIRNKVDKAEFENFSTVTELSAHKEWVNEYSTPTIPEGAQVTYLLLADGVDTEKTITLDGTKDTRGEDEPWVATWRNLDVYRKDAFGNLIPVEGSDDYERIAYTVRETKCTPSSYKVVGKRDREVTSVSRAEFVNEYKANGTYELKGTKTIENRSFQDGDTWTFTVKGEEIQNDAAPEEGGSGESGSGEEGSEGDDSGESDPAAAASTVPMPPQTEVTINPKTGTVADVSFGTIEYTEKDINKTYKYTITESGTVAGVENDPAPTREIVVEVKDNKDGTLSVTKTVNSDTFAYTNTYKSSGTAEFKGQKTLKNRVFNDDDKLIVAVEGKDGAKVPNPDRINVDLTPGQNTATYAFAPITYTHEDLGGKDSAEFEYIVTETPTMAGTTREGGVHTVKVAVSEHSPKKDGKLDVDIVYSDGDEVSFINTYSATGDVTIEGKKTIQNRPFQTGDTLTVTVSADEGVRLPSPATRTVTLTNGQNTAAFDFGTIAYTLDDMKDASGKLLEEKTFVYTVTETAYMKGTTADAAEHTVTVKLTDDKKGHLVPEVTYSDGEQVEFTNTYDASGSIALSGTKFISNRAFKEGDTATIKIEAVTNGAPMPSEHEVTVSPDVDTSSQSYRFGPITYTLAHAGGANSEATYQYKVTESACSMDGVTKDSKEYIVTVTVKDTSTGALTVTANNQDALDFTNIYNATGSTVLKATKKIQNRKFLASDADKWTFTVSAADDAPLPNPSSVTITPTAGESSYDFEFAAINYDESDIGKTYTYTITESGEVAGVTNAAAQAVTVKVEDNKDGTLKVTNSTDSDKPVFVNTYEAEGETTLRGAKIIENRDFQKNDKWTFTLTGPEGAPMPSEKSVTIEPEEGRSAEFSFGPIQYATADIGKEYTYTITESGKVNGVTNDAVTAKTVTVKVTDNGDRTLSIENSTSANPVTFTNSYAATGKVQFSGVKTIENRKFRNGDTLKVTLSGDNLTENQEKTVSLTAGKTSAAFSFDEITYSLSDMGGSDEKTFTYTIAEEAVMAGTTADGKSHTVTVKLTDDKQGHLVPEVTYSDGDKIAFTNTYDAEGEIVFGGTKTIQNRKFKDGDSATIKIEAQTEGAPMPDDDEVTIVPTAGTESQAYAFEAIKFDLNDLPRGANSSKIFQYKITESESDMAGVTKDTKNYIAKVTVTDDGSGTLSVSSNIDNAALDFTNTYTATGEIELGGTKSIENREFHDGDSAVFKIARVTEGAPMPDNDTARVTPTYGDSVEYAFGKITYDLADAGGANSSQSYKYKITEFNQAMSGVTKDDTSYEITVTVADTGTGELTVTSTNKSELNFTNIYDARGNIQFKGSKTIEGRKFKDGDSATFKIEAITEGAPLPENKTTTVSPTSGDKVGYALDAIEYELKDLPGGANSSAEFKYRVSESASSMEGVTKDDNAYEITVTVTDNGSGKLAVESDVNKAALDFTNTYNATGSIKFGGKKTIKNRDFQPGDTATIALEAVTTGAPMPDVDEVTVSADSGNAIHYAFEKIEYALSDIPNGAGHSKQFKYKVFETDCDMDGVTKDSKVYNITVTVADNNTGTLTVTSNIAKDALNFTNTYNAKGSAEIVGTKEMVGRAFRAGDEWTFTIASEDEDAPLPAETSVALKANEMASFKFQKIAYDVTDLADVEADADGARTKTFTYTVTESGDIAGVTNDVAKTVRVTVTDRGKGTLEVKTDVPEGKLTFQNTYRASGHTELAGTKMIAGRQFKDGDEWTFTVSAAEGVPMPEHDSITINPKSGASAEVDFGSISYTQADVGKTYTYTITESGEVVGVTNDSAKTVTVEVSDKGDGTLKVANSATKTPVVFENTYEATGSTTLAATKTISGRDFQDGDEWTFTVAADDESAPMPAQNPVTIKPKSGASAEVDFGSIAFTEVDAGKTYSYTITETGEVTNVTNDAVRTAIISIDDNGDGTLEVRNSQTRSPATFTNTYSADGEAGLKATKQIYGRQFQDGDSWTFTVSAAEGVPMPEHDSITINPKSGASAELDFGKIAFTQADAGKTYTYTITESGAVAGVTNDSEAKEVTIAVTDNGDGTLQVTNSANKTPVIFENTYDATGSTTLAATKTISGRDFQNGDEWTFTVAADDASAPMPAQNPVTIDPMSGASAEVDFGSISYTLADVGKTYTYTITESGEVAGVTNDSAKTVTVEVSDKGDGTLQVTNSANKTPVVFTNEYAASGKLVLSGRKSIKDKPDTMDLSGFKFTVTEDGEKVATGASDADGTITFDEISYESLDSVGIHTYVVSEDADTKDGVTNTKEAKTVVVEVSDNGDGTLKAEASQGGVALDAVSFENEYKAEGSVVLSVSKTFNDWSKADGFGFTLTAVTKGAPMPADDGNKATVTESKTTADFGTITYTKAGTYEYAITEDVPTGVTVKASTNDGITYDVAARTVTVTVTDNGDGTLSAEADYGTSGNVFVNTYSASGEVVLGATKSFNDWTKADGFGFTLAAVTEGAPMPAGNGNKATATESEAALFGKITYDEPGIYEYVITEDVPAGVTRQNPIRGGITYDTSEKHVTVTVTDDGKGHLTATPSVLPSGLTFANTYETTEVTGRKVWVDDATHADDTRPESITVQLQSRKGTGDWTDVAGKTATLTGDETSFSFTNLPKYDDRTELDYRVIETNVPEGYVATGGTVDDEYVITNTITEKREAEKPTSLTVRKVSADEEPLAGATFTLTSSDGSTKDYVTGTDGRASIEFTTTGTWTLQETKAPSGYVVNDQIYNIEVTRNGIQSITYETGNAVWTWLYNLVMRPMLADGTLTVEDEQTSVKVAKVDVAGKELAGVTLQVLDEAGKIVKEWTTKGSKGEAEELRGLVTDVRYVIHEAQAPAGYVKAQDAAFTISAKGEVKYLGAKRGDGALLVVNSPTSGTATLVVSKVVAGEEGWDESEEYEFELRKVDATTSDVISTDTTKVKAGKTGEFGAITYVQPGTYDYVITEVPGTGENMSYDLAPRYARVVVTQNASDSTVLDAAITYSTDGRTYTEDVPTFTNIHGSQIEKFVNKARHADSTSFDQDLTYDIVAFVTSDACWMRVTDDLPNALEFATEADGSVKVDVRDLGTYNDHRDHGTVEQVAGTEIGGEFVSVDANTTANKLVVDVYRLDEIGLREHWVKISFKAHLNKSAVTDVASIANTAHYNIWDIEFNPDVEPPEPTHGNFTPNADVTPPVTEVSVSKEWKDSEGAEIDWPEGAEVTVELLRDGEATGERRVLTSDEPSVTFTELATDDEQSVQYSVAESSVSGVPEGYTTAVTGDVANGYVITNTLPPATRSVSVTKTWQDSNEEAIDWPADVTVTVELLKDGEATGKTVELTADEPTATFDDLEAGDDIVYSVSEANVTGVPAAYTTEVEETDDGAFTITNTLSYTEVSVEKLWKNDDGDDIDWPEGAKVTVEVLQDGMSMSPAITKDLTEDETEWTFEELPVGHEYTVRETAVAGTMVNVTSETTGSVDEGFTITNTVTEVPAPKVKTIEVAKAWQDTEGNEAEWPEGVAVTVELLADGEPLDPARTIELTADEPSGSFKVQVDEDADESVEYTVRERAVTGGAAGFSVSVAGNADEGFTITNKQTPTLREVSVTKTWVGSDGKEMEWPKDAEVTVELLADGKALEPAATLVLNAKSTSGTFTGLANDETKYTVREVKVSGADAGFSVKESGSGDARKLTNTYGTTPPTPTTPPTTTTPPTPTTPANKTSTPSTAAHTTTSSPSMSTTKTSTPKTGDRTQLGALITCATLGAAVVLVGVRRRRRS